MLKFAIQNLYSRPMRSLLALLGLTVAIAGMVGLFSVAEGLDDTVSRTFGKIPGLLAMQQGAPIPLFSNIPASWGEEIEEIDGVSAVSPEIWTRVNMIDGKRIVSPPRFFFGTDIPSQQKLSHSIYRDELTDGRFLTLDDRGQPHTIISEQIAEEFSKGVGDSLKVNGYDLKIVGIYHCGSMLLDVAIILDIEQVRSMSRVDPQTVSCFYIEQSGTVDDETLAKSIRQAFRGRELDQWQPSGLLSLGDGGSSGNLLSDFFKQLDRSLKSTTAGQSGTTADSADQPTTAPAPTTAATAGSTPAPKAAPTESAVQAETTPTDSAEDEENTSTLEVRSASDWAERFDEFSSDLDLFLTIMTSIGVTIAVLSIVNTMLMSVTERMIEFGILRANGWSKGDILKLITFESCLIGVGGGLLGCVFGWIGTQVVNWNWPEHIQLYASPQLLVFSLAFSTLLGVVGGLYPAVWASRMMPMDAIRRG